MAYWPFNLNDMRDYVTFNEMQYCEGFSFTDDRFNNPSSAVFFNVGYCQVQSEVYFDGSDFTVSAWVYVFDFASWSRIFDCGNGVEVDNIVFAITGGDSGQPVIGVYNTDNNLGTFVLDQISSQTALNLYTWQYVAGVLNKTHLLIYVDGFLTNWMLIDTRPNNILRLNCYIGASNWLVDQLANAVIDDVKVYNRALSEQEILQDMYIHSF